MTREARFPGIAVCWCVVVGALVAGGAAEAQVIEQLTQNDNTIPMPPVLDDAGTTVFVPVATNQLGNNPSFKIQIFEFNATTGAGSLVAALDEGVSVQDFPENLNEALPRMVAASDDGQWLGVLAVADPAGTNKDRSTELFVMKSDGTMISQLSSDPGPNAGDVSAFDIDGSGDTLFYFARQNPPSLNTNPSRYGQLFKINRDGTGLAQLTSFTSDARCVRVSVSDDGTRVAFSYAGTGDWDSDGTTDNPDGSDEIFKINSDGTGLVQLTEGTFNSLAPHLAGNGSKIAFQSREDHTPGGTNNNPSNWNEVFVINWDGTNLVQLIQTDRGTSGEGVTGHPMMTDNGSEVIFQSNHKHGTANSDFNSEIFKIDSNASSATLRQLTDTVFSAGTRFPSVSGDGSRVVFSSVNDFVGISNNPDESPELYAKSSTPIPDTSDLIQLTSGLWGPNRFPDISSDGSTIVFVSKYDPIGGNPDRGGEIYTMDLDGSNLALITSLGYAERTESPSISGDGLHITFVSDCDDTFAGCSDNTNGTKEVWYTNAAGTTLTQISEDTGLGDASKAEFPVISDDGAWIYWEQNTDQLGTNPDFSREIFRSDKTANQQLQLTSGASGTACRKPRTDDTGTWVVFECNADLTTGNADGSLEIFRVKFDGSGTQQITSGAAGVDSVEPDISGDASTIVYASSWDPLGTNADGNQELFRYDVGTSAHTQLTFTTTGASSFPRMSNDGRYVYFLTDSEMFETDPDVPIHQALVDLTTSSVVRIGGVDDGNPTVPLPTGDGRLAVFSGIGNFTRENFDLHREVWLIDRRTLNEIGLSGPAPTTVSWAVEAGALRYDVVRGNVANLAPGAPGTTDLGAVVCLEDNSVDTDTLGDEDLTDPPTGQAFFYVFRAIQGLTVGPSHYGLSSNGDDRLGGAGNCSL